MKKHTTALGTAPLGPLMVRLSVPGMVGMLVASLYNIVDTFWVAGLPEGTHAIAALTVLFPIQMIAGALGMGLTAGVTSLVARRFGAARLEEAQCAAGNALLLAVGMGTVLALALLPLARPAVLLFGATTEILEPSVAYLTIVACGFPFLLFTMTSSGLYRGSGDTLVPMLLQLIGALLNAALDPFLIYGWGPFPRLGIAGAALATIISQGVGAGCSLAYLFGRRSGYTLGLHHFRLRWRILADIAQVGAPTAADSCLRSVAASLTNWVLGSFGPAALAAHGLSMRVMMLMISCLGGGVNQALVPTVGYCFGAGDYRRLWRAYRIAALWTGIGGFLIGGLLFVFAVPVLAPFTREPELARLGPLALRLRVCTFFLVEPQMMAVFMFQGMGMGGRAMALTMSRNVLLVLPLLFPLAWLFGAPGAFAAQSVADVLCLFLTAALVVQTYRRYPPSASVGKPAAVAA
jgi:putative MATE family efflux protein